jgi:transposase
VAERRRFVRGQQRHEVEFLLGVGAWVVVTQRQLHEINGALAKSGETTQTFPPMTYGALYCERRVVRYGLGDVHLQVAVQRRSDWEWGGLRQAAVRGDLSDYHRRAVQLRQGARTVVLVGHKPLIVPRGVEARIRARGEDPDAFKAAMVKSLRQRERHRLSSWKADQAPKPLYGHRTFDLPPLASDDGAAVAIAIPLAQEGLIAAETVKSFLVKTMGVRTALVDDVWDRLRGHYGDSQQPLSLSAYISRIIKGVRPGDNAGVFWDASGLEYWTAQRVAQELGRNKATIHRWMKDGMITGKAFAYQVGSGAQKVVKAVARDEIEPIKATRAFDESVISLLAKAHKITRESAERQYRRICRRLGIEAGVLIKSDAEKAAIGGTLQSDPKLTRLFQQGHRGTRSGENEEESGDSME